jgi:cell division protein ZapA
MEKTRTTVRIAGKDYIISGHDSEEFVRRVATYVDRKIKELRAATKLPGDDIAVLAAVNVTDDMLKALDENARLRDELLDAQQALQSAEDEITLLKSRPRKASQA